MGAATDAVQGAPGGTLDPPTLLPPPSLSPGGPKQLPRERRRNKAKWGNGKAEKVQHQARARADHAARRRRAMPATQVGQPVCLAPTVWVWPEACTPQAWAFYLMCADNGDGRQAEQRPSE